MSGSLSYLAITSTSPNKAEGQAGTNIFTFTVTRTGATDQVSMANWTVIGTGSSPAMATDFVGGMLPSGIVTFGASETSKNITIFVLADSIVEHDEAFLVSLTSPSVGSVIISPSSVGYIQNDDASLAIAASDTNKSEGQSGSTAFTFTVTRSGDTSVSQTAAWAVTGTGSNPASATDFVGGLLPSGTVNFATGETTKTITVLVAGDSTVEANEDFTVTVGSATASSTIQNDDASLAIAASDTNKREGNTGSTDYTFTVSRSGDVGQASFAKWQVDPSPSYISYIGDGDIISLVHVEPVTPTDFLGGALPSGVVSFAAGEISKTITITVTGDRVVEPYEGFTVTLSNTSVGTIVATPTAMATIINDDLDITHLRNDAYVTINGSSLNVTAAIGLLSNDSNANFIYANSQPRHGVLFLDKDGSFIYNPFYSFTGTDFFTYGILDDNNNYREAYVALHVIPATIGASTTLGLFSLPPQEQIAATYVAFFGRGADLGGFNFWVDQFVKNPTQDAATLFANIASSFAVGDEAKALYPFLANPAGASNAQIEAFLSKVYDNLFNRTPDAEGLAYWRGEIQNTLKAGQFVGSVLVNIMNGAQNSPAGQDITTLMSKVAVSLEYVQQQGLYGTEWTWADDQVEAMALLDPVGDVPETLLIGMANAQALVLADLVA